MFVTKVSFAGKLGRILSAEKEHIPRDDICNRSKTRAFSSLTITPASFLFK
jgi:hypothetical protein